MVCTCEETTGDSYQDDCPYLMAAYILAGLSMMLNIRLAYSSAPYALIRFRLPENLFSVFVRRMASALEFWCLPSMLLGNIIEIAQRATAYSKSDFKLNHTQAQDDDKLGKLIEMKQKKYGFIIVPSMVTMWSDFITYLVLLIVYTMGDQGHVTAYYFVIAVSGFIFGINMVFVYAADWRYTPVYIAGENAFPMLTSIIHYITTLIFGNRRKWNSDFLIVCIDISVAIIISFVTAIMWTSVYGIMEHKSTNKILRFGVIGWSAYGTTRNTSVTFKVNLNRNTEFASSGTITITVTKGGNNFTALNSVSTVTITLSSGGTIKKCVDGQPQAFTTGTTLDQGTKLVLEATGRISTPASITGSEVTIKGDLTVTSNQIALGTDPLNLAGNTGEDPSSQGLGGSITPTGASATVTIGTSSTITLGDKALDALKSLTKNAVTLSPSTGNFRSSASITVTRTSGDTNFKTLDLKGQSLQITISSGTIKNSDGTLQTASPTLPAGTQLSLDATGQITQGGTGTVNLEGTIVVTNQEPQSIGSEALSFGGGPNREGVTGSLTLENESSPPKYINITASGSTLTINNNAYAAIKIASDTTSSSFTIGAADPRNPTEATGADSLWHLLPSDMYDKNDLPDWEVISPALMVIIGMGFVYCIYPGIAPGMIVPFYLVDKIETVLLVLTTFPPVIVAILQKHAKQWSPKTLVLLYEAAGNKKDKFGGWTNYSTNDFSSGIKAGDPVYGWIWHFFDILMIIKMTLLVIFIYCLHYRDSHISRSIVNQPKMSTFLTIVFYMCHECLLALGFSGVIGNNGATYIVLPAQYVGALLMIFLAFYSEGYIIEYKSHDPAH